MTSAERPTLHLVVGVDDRPTGLHALRRAADLAARLHAHLDVLHVADATEIAAHTVPPGLGGLPAADRDLQHAVRAEAEHRRDVVAGEIRAYEVEWTFHTAVGEPAGALAALAEEVDAYCIVVGSRGEGVGAALSRLLHPSVTHALINARHRPVLIVTQTDS